MNNRYLLSLLFLLTASIRVSALDTLRTRYNEQHPVTVVCDWDRPPYEYIDNNGQLAGSNIDVIRAIMDELDLPVHFVMKDWSAALNTFRNGDADIILADARRFTDSIFYASRNIVTYNHICVATYKDSLKQISIPELNRKGTVLKTGEYSVNYFQADSSSSLKVEYQTPKVALLGLTKGDYKYFIWGEMQLKSKVHELNLKDIVINNSQIPISEIRFIGRDSLLVEVIDDQYSRLKQSGELQDLKDRWLHPEQHVQRHLPAAISVLLIALLAALGLYLLSRVAKAHINRSTREMSLLNTMMVKALHMGNYDVMVYDIARNRVENRYGHILPDKGMTLEEFTARIHPDQQQEFIQKSRDLIKGRNRRFDLNKRWNQGTPDEPHWLNFQGHAILETNAHGKPAYVINAVYDVTHEVEEHKAARILNYKYNALSNAPLVAMSFYDKQGNLIEFNESMKQLIGLTDKTPQLKHFWQAVNLFDVQHVRGVLTPKEHDAKLYCHHLNYPDFHIDKYVESYIYPLLNDQGEIANYLVGSINITPEQSRDKKCHELEHERERLNEEIRELSWLLRYTLIQSKRLLVRIDLQEQSATFSRTPGYREYAHPLSRLLAIIDEADRETVSSLISDGSQNSPRTVRLRVKPHVGCHHTTVYRLTLSPRFTASGELTGHIGVITDITNLSIASRQLEQATQLAKDSLRMKSGFMASMTHELRTPLNAIVGFTGILDALGDAPERSEYVHIIRNSSDMLQRLINDIIEASSFSDGTVDINRRKVDFPPIFDEICMTLEQRVQNPDVTFIKDNPYKSLIVNIDTGRFHQILTNFVTNAVKFTQQGHIKVGYSYDYGEMYVYCEDTGKGIPEDKQAAIFDRFVKLDEYAQGTGMGLAISKNIVENGGGTIGVTSEGEGHGSTFWCRIPC